MIMWQTIVVEFKICGHHTIRVPNSSPNSYLASAASTLELCTGLDLPVNASMMQITVSNVRKGK